ncbi:hypothetical protein ACFL12_08240 [Pseudomonadota bacterium]
MKHVLYLTGAVFLALGFLSIVAEMAAHATNPDLPIIASVADVWRTFNASGFDAVQERIGALSYILALPGWVLLGVPGFALVISFRTHSEDDAHAAHEESLFLFDELTKHAQEEGHQDDLSITHLGVEDLADPRYAKDDIVVDGQAEHDFLLSDKTPPTKP